jgi:hypothetical protein
MKNNKKYTQPKITAVDLDPSQAIIQACYIGGAYFNIDQTGCLGGVGGVIGTCLSTVKGAVGYYGAFGVITEVSSKPS